MLYPYQTAEEHRAPLRERALLRQPAGLLALELVCTINDLFTAAPSLLYQEGTKGLLLLYRDSACDTSYLEEECRELMACLSSHWETALYGTAPGGETGELTFHLEEGNRILCRTRCVSGRPFDQLSGLCVKLEADSSEHAARLRDVLGQIRYNARCCAVDRRAGAFLDENEILEDQDGSLYRYLTLEGDPSPIDYLPGPLFRAEAASLAHFSSGRRTAHGVCLAPRVCPGGSGILHDGVGAHPSAGAG